MSSRLSRSIERRLAIQKGELAPTLGGEALPLRSPNVQARPRPVDVTPDQLVPMLALQGHQPRYTVGRVPGAPIGFIQVSVGPVNIPLPFDAQGGRRLVDEITAVCEQLILEQQPTPMTPEMEQLLAESQAAVGGPVPAGAEAEDDLTFELVAIAEDGTESVIAAGPTTLPFLPAEACADSPA